MTTEDSSNRAPAGEALFTLVRNCQQSYEDWSSATDSAEALRDAHTANVERLWMELAPHLRKVAYGWRRSDMAPDVESMAIGMFAHIIFTLPRLRLDPNKDIRSYLLQIAKNCTVDEYRQVYAERARRLAKQPEDARESGTRAASLGPEKASLAEAQHSADPAAELVDSSSYDAEDQLIAGIDNDACLQAIWDFWDTLAGVDRQIVDLRWRSEPPASFRAIARLIGAGWAEDTIRQRHHRIIKETRRYLQQQGLWLDTGSV